MPRPAPSPRPSGDVRRGTPARRGPASSGPNPLRVGGILLLLAALGRLVEHFVIRHWVKFESGETEAFTYAAFAGLLGLSLLQGSDGARKMVLWLNGLLLLVGLGLALGAAAVPDLRPALPLAFLVVVGALALFGILGGSPSAGRVTLCAALFLVALGGRVLVDVWLLKGSERELRNMVEEWAGPERDYADEKAGLRVKLPEGWVVLKPGNPLVDTVGTKLALGQQTVGALAALYEDSGTSYLSLDDYLDQWFADRKTRIDDLKQQARKDVDVGKTQGRQMTMSWSAEGLRVEGALSAWKDGRRYFGFLAFTTGGLATRAAPEFERLEKALVFDAPVATHVKDAVARVVPACPLLSAGAVETMTRSMPKGASVELYCRRGYEWAVRGVREMGGDHPARMGAITSKVFASLGAGDRERLGRYLERVQAGAATSPAEDRAMNELLGRGIRSLPDGEQAELRGLVETAIEVGRLSSS